MRIVLIETISPNNKLLVYRTNYKMIRTRTHTNIQRLVASKCFLQYESQRNFFIGKQMQNILELVILISFLIGMVFLFALLQFCNTNTRLKSQNLRRFLCVCTETPQHHYNRNNSVIYVGRNTVVFYTNCPFQLKIHGGCRKLKEKLRIFFFLPRSWSLEGTFTFI